MKTKFLTITLAFIALTVQAQNVVKTYYDYEKTHVKEEFYANSYGVKNGIYKAFSEYGGVLIQGTFNDDKKEGEWIVKDDKGHLVSKETYKGDVLNGLASYYNFDVFGTVPKASGTYKDGEKVGVWNCIDELLGSEGTYYSDLPRTDQLQYSDEWKKAVGHTLGIKYSDDYSDTKHKKQIWTFYPSGQEQGEKINNINGTTNKLIIYYPNGKLYRLYVVDSTGKVVFDREWYFPDGGDKDSVDYYMASKTSNSNKMQKTYNQINADSALLSRVEYFYTHSDRFKAGFTTIFNKAMIYRDALLNGVSACTSQDCLNKIGQSINQLFNKLESIEKSNNLEAYYEKLQNLTTADEVKTAIFERIKPQHKEFISHKFKQTFIIKINNKTDKYQFI